MTARPASDAFVRKAYGSRRYSLPKRASCEYARRGLSRGLVRREARQEEFGGTGERVAVYQTGDAGVVYGVGGDRRISQRACTASGARRDARPPRLADASRACRCGCDRDHAGIRDLVACVSDRRRATASSRAGRCCLFVLTLPMWLLLAKLQGLYERDEERTDHSTTDELAGVARQS